MNNIKFLIQKQKELEEIESFDKNKNELLARNFQSLSPQEQELFMLNNCRLVFKMASHYSYQNSVLQEELISSGILGLQKAIMSFDMNKNVSFSAYASICIRNEMFLFLRVNRKYQSNIELDSPPMSTNVEHLTKLDTIQLLLGLVETENNIINEIYEQDLLSEILCMIYELPEKDFYILMHSYGIGEYTKLNQEYIANKLSLSQAHVSRKRKSIVKKLRKELIKKHCLYQE